MEKTSLNLALLASVCDFAFAIVTNLISNCLTS